MSDDVSFRFHHVAISVSDRERSVAFYALLGFNELRRFSIPNMGAEVVMMECGLAELEIFEFQSHKPFPEYRRNIVDDLTVLGTKHFAMSVSDLDAARQQLLGAGLGQELKIIMGGGGKRYFFISDPDGLLIEVIEAG